MNVPCKDCNKRQVGCHSSCEDYKTYKTENNKRNEKIKRERDADLFFLNKRG